MKAGRELDDKMATDVMGWEEVELGGISYWQKPITTAAAGSYQATGYAVSIGAHPDTTPRLHSIWGFDGFFTPSTQIADAWLVVEKFVNGDSQEEYLKFAFQCRYACGGDLLAPEHIACKRICLAALKAVE